jgi:multiple sugar transport system substrate-binding protein
MLGAKGGELAKEALPREDKMKRILLSLALLGAIATAPATAQSDITFANWFYEAEIKATFEKVRPAFEEANDDVGTVKVETIPFPKYFDTLNVRLASGTPPDVAWIHAGQGPALIGADKLVDLTPYIEADPGFNIADYGAAIEPWKKDGKVYGVPFTNAGNVMYYNEELFAKAGLPTPRQLLEEGNWTWDKVRELSRDLVAKGGARYGYMFGNNVFVVGWQNLVELFAPFGASPWSADGKTCMFNDAKTVAALQFVHDMIYVDKTHPEPGVEADFAAGDIGMSLTRPNFAFRLKDVTFKWDVVPNPSGPEGYVPSRAQNAMGAFKGAAHEDLGAKFAVFATNPANAALWTASPSPRASLQTIAVLSSNNVLNAEQLERAVIPALTSEKFQMEYTHRNYAPLTAEVQRLFGGLIWVPEVDLASATTDLCNQIGPLLQ